MVHIPELDKLAELRARTDRELIALIDRLLEAGLNGARSRDTAKAENAYNESVKLLRLIYELDESDRARLNARLQRLRAALNGKPKAFGAGRGASPLS